MQIFSLSLIIPIAYLGILVGSLATFSHLYRQRKLNAKLLLAPYFPPHQSRNLYLSLMHIPEHNPSTKVPDSVLRAALLNRAVDDIYRIMEIRSRKQPLNTLLQRGVVGDEMWQRLLRAEQELEIEIKDVVSEANALTPGWGQTIFQSASEMAQNRLLKEKLAAITKTVPEEVERWENQRSKARQELEGELASTPAAGTTTTTTTQSSTNEQKPTNIEVPATTTTAASVTSEKIGSDEDGVIVDTPSTPGTSTTGGGGGGGGGGSSKNKKKKGKK